LRDGRVLGAGGALRGGGGLGRRAGARGGGSRDAGRLLEAAHHPLGLRMTALLLQEAHRPGHTEPEHQAAQRRAPAHRHAPTPSRITSEYSAGIMPIASAHRQPLCPSAATKVPTTAARIQPSAQNASSHTITRPRIRAGANSLIRVEATGSSAPRPSPTTKRSAISIASPVDRAEAPVATP